MRILITGATGMVGSRLLAELCEEGHEVRGLRRLVSGVASEPAYIWGDVTEPESLHDAEQFKPEIVCHLAAIATNAYALAHPLETHQVNAYGTAVIVQMCRRLPGLRALILASSSEVYGGAREPVTETTPLRADMPYAAAKIAAEYSVRASGVPFVISRAFNTFGRALVGAPRSVVDEIIVQAMRDGHIDLENPNPRRAFMFREHHVAAYLSIIHNLDKAIGEAFNFGPAQAWSIGEVAAMIVGEANIPIQYAGSERPGETPLLVNGSQKATLMLEWHQPSKAEFYQGVVQATSEWAKVLRR